jgi:O-antigen/teichoic acid export membrane protein
MSGTEFFGQLFMWPKEKIKILFKLPNSKSVKEHFRGMLILFSPILIIQVYTVMNSTLLGLLSSRDQLAFFDYSNRIVAILISISTSLGLIMLSRISNLSAKNNEKEIKDSINWSLSITLFVSLPLTFGLIGIKDIFITWFLAAEYRYVAFLLTYFPIKIILVSISNVLGVQYLIPIGKNKEFIISVLIGATSSIIMNLFLVPPYGAIGAVFSLILSESVVTIAQLLYAKNIIDLKKLYPSFWRVSVTSVLMLIFLKVYSQYLFDIFFNLISTLTKQGYVSNIFSTLAVIIVSAFLYSLSLFVLNEPTIRSAIMLIKKRFKN